MPKVKYEHYPTKKMIDEAGLQQLTLWLNWLPAPLTKAEEFLYNSIVKRRDTFLPPTLTT